MVGPEAEYDIQSDLRTKHVARKNGIVLWSIATAHIVFVAVITPLGIQYGDWAIPELVYVASGATGIYSAILLPLWIGLGTGDFLKRFGCTLLFLLALFVAEVTRSSLRDHHQPLVFHLVPFLFVLTSFSGMTLVFRSIYRHWNWRLGILSDGSPIWTSAIQYRPQFNVWHLLMCTTLVAVLLASCRLIYPDGMPDETRIFLWNQVVSHLQIFPFMIVLLPIVFVPWSVLAFQGNFKSTFIVVVEAVICWSVIIRALIWHGGILKFLHIQEVLWIQLGATLAALMSALVLRACGYRVFRIRRELPCDRLKIETIGHVSVRV